MAHFVAVNCGGFATKHLLFRNAFKTSTTLFKAMYLTRSSHVAFPFRPLHFQTKPISNFPAIVSIGVFSAFSPIRTAILSTLLMRSSSRFMSASSNVGDDDKKINESSSNAPDAHDETNEFNLELTSTVRDAQQPVSDMDVDRELLRYDYEDFVNKPDEPAERVKAVGLKKKLPISLERGKSGVFDIEELVALLRDENARDICVIRIPKEYEFVDHMVIVTGKSTRHIRAIAEYIKWMYKRKRSSQDAASVNIEGEQTNDWFAIDLGNIAVHLFLRNTRLTYDLEMLWSVGVEHDDKSRHCDDALTTDVRSAMQLEDFSFDAELERLRKMRGLATVAGGPVTDNDDAQSSVVGMENVANWHRVPER